MAQRTPSDGSWRRAPSDAVWRRAPGDATWMRHRGELPLLLLPFDDSGLHLADLGLTVNDQTVYPAQIRGKTAADPWPTSEGDLDQVENGPDLTLDVGTPLFGERGVEGPTTINHTGDYYQAEDEQLWDVDEEDFVFVAIETPSIVASAVSADIAASKFKIAGGFPANGIGYEHLFINTGSWYLRLGDSVSVYKDMLIAGVVTLGTTQVFIGVASKSMTNGGRSFVIGVGGGGQVDLTTVGSISSPTDFFRLFQRGSGPTTSYPFRGKAIAYLLYRRDAWITADANLNGTYAEVRRIMTEARGLKARRAVGSAQPTAASRASVAAIELVEPSGSRRIHTVGADWAGRMVCPPGQSTPWLLCEPIASTNLYQQNRSLNLSPNAPVQCTIGADATVAPSGRLEAEDTIEGTFTNSNCDIRQTITISNGQRYCVSGYTKFLDRRVVHCFLAIGGATRLFTFDDAGAIDSVANLAADEYGLEYQGDDWWRWWMSTVSNGTSAIVGVQAAESLTVSTIAASVPGQHAHADWSRQLEQYLRYPSSPIWTPSAGSATRAAELIQYSAVDNIHPGQGRIRIEAIVPPAAHTSAVPWTISDGLSVNDYISLRIASSTGKATLDINSTESGLTTLTGTTNLRASFAPHVIEVSYRAGRALLIVDGVVEAEGAPATIPDDLDTISIGHDVASAGAIHWIRNFQTFREVVA
jgi:hypothetical protein